MWKILRSLSPFEVKETLAFGLFAAPEKPLVRVSYRFLGVTWWETTKPASKHKINQLLGEFHGIS